MRRPRTVEPLRQLGADIVLLDGTDLQERIAAATGGASIKLGIEAVAGEASQKIAQSLAVGGTIVNYGLLSGEHCTIDPSEVIFRDIQLRGFWRAKWQITAPPEEVSRVTEHLVGLICRGRRRSSVHFGNHTGNRRLWPRC